MGPSIREALLQPGAGEGEAAPSAPLLPADARDDPWADWSLRLPPEPGLSGRPATPATVAEAGVPAAPGAGAGPPPTFFTPGYARPCDAVPLLNWDLAEWLAGSSGLVVRQRTRWLEALTFGCWDQPNVFDVFDPQTGARPLEMEMVANCAFQRGDASTRQHARLWGPTDPASSTTTGCTKFWCSPNHSFLLNFYVIDPASGQRLAHAMTVRAADVPAALTRGD